MNAYLERLLLAALAFAVFGCNNYESKKAHAALQSVEFKFRDIDLAHPQIAEQSGYRILCIRGKTSNVFVLLNPRSIPYYSQLPEREHFTLTEAEFSAIVKQHIASRTVLNVLATKIQQDRVPQSP